MQTGTLGAARRTLKFNHLTPQTVINWLLRWSVLLLFTIFFGVPLLWLLLAITKTDNQLLDWHPMAFGSLEHIGVAWNNLMNFNNGQVVRWALNSVIYASSAVLLSMVITLPTGYALGVMRFGGRRALLWLTLILMILPGSALVLPLFLEMSFVRLVNTPYAVILPVAFYPFGVYLTFIFYKTSMPPELLDAGRVDGCNELQLFWFVGLPLSRALLGLLAFLSFSNQWNNYFLPFVMLNDDRLYTLPVGIQALISSTSALRPTFATNLNIFRAEAALLGVITIVPVALVFIFAQRFLTSGALAGATKG